MWGDSPQRRCDFMEVWCTRSFTREAYRCSGTVNPRSVTDRGVRSEAPAVEEAVMTRLVRGADGRMWTVRYQMEWVNPATGDDFEHDVSIARASGVFMAVLIGTLVAVLVAWKESEGVVIPAWFLLALALVLLFFPARWALRRPWNRVAAHPGDLDDHPPERWAG